MPVIKLWCLPRLEESKLREIHKTVVSAVVGIEELGLKGENDMTVLFPPDMMSYGLGTEVIVEILIFDKPERTEEVQNRLAEAVGLAIQEHLPEAKLEVFIDPFDRKKKGFWTSVKMT